MKALLFSSFCLLSTIVWSQLDPLYNQYQFNQQMINPAYTGIYNRISAGLISRVQWAGIEGAPVTNTLTFQSALNKGRIGLGALVINDRLGINDNTEAFISTSYNIIIGENKLSMGLQGGMISYRYDLSRLTLDYVDDTQLVNGLDNISEPNFGAGLMFMTPKYYVGASVPRILNISVSDGVTNSSRYRQHYYLTGGYIYEATRFLMYRINGLVRYVDNEQISYDLTLSGYLDQVAWTGFTVRDLRDVGAFVILEVGKYLRLGYSVEFPTNSLIQSNFGTHEISVTIDKSHSREYVVSKRRF